MSTAASTPGLYFTVAATKTEQSPLRSDVAGFAGRTRRGPVGVPIRVEGWRQYLREFGGVMPDADTPNAIRGYFENGGEVAYVIRLAAGDASNNNTLQSAKAEWVIGNLDQQTLEWELEAPVDKQFQTAAYFIEATSPGSWANGLRVSIRYRSEGISISKQPEVDIIVQPRDEPVEYLLRLDPRPDPLGVPDSDHLAKQVEAASVYIRLIPNKDEIPRIIPNAGTGPRTINFEFILEEGSEGTPDAPSELDYLSVVETLGDEQEISLVALPDLHVHVTNDDQRWDILSALIAQAEFLHDRMILIDLPPDMSDALSAQTWVGHLREFDEKLRRCGIVYHPRLQVTNPVGGIAHPLRILPPCGHVAGLISRLDRDRGAHHTPANASLFDAVDLERDFIAKEQVILNEGGINLLRCFPGRGLQVWGGRTLASESTNRFIAHRRLIHRLVRVIRRVADPLVFDTNGPELWLTLVRGVTTVLLEAFRAGALKGNRPDQAFRVRCDETTNPPEARDQGLLLCEIEVAPVVPMEFIVLRIAISNTGTLQVIE